MTEKPPPNRSLILVYNADSGLFNALTDSLHKLLSPSTHECRLCALTYGVVGMRREWALFLRNLKIPVRLIHRDEFHSQFPHLKIDLPSVLIQSAAKLDPLISSEEIKKCTSLHELEELLQTKAYATTGYT
jgi:hypothetical protein